MLLHDLHQLFTLDLENFIFLRKSLVHLMLVRHQPLRVNVLMWHV